MAYSGTACTGNIDYLSAQSNSNCMNSTYNSGPASQKMAIVNNMVRVTTYGTDNCSGAVTSTNDYYEAGKCLPGTNLTYTSPLKFLPSLAATTTTSLAASTSTAKVSSAIALKFDYSVISFGFFLLSFLI